MHLFWFDICIKIPIRSATRIRVIFWSVYTVDALLYKGIYSGRRNKIESFFTRLKH